jgi:hypothetical protein
MDPDIPAATFGGPILRREAARWWWAPLVGAVLWFVIAWLVLRGLQLAGHGGRDPRRGVSYRGDQ